MKSWIEMTKEEHEKWDSGRKGGMIRRLKEGYTMPLGWGVYRYNMFGMHYLIAPIPLNFIFRWIYDMHSFFIQGVKSPTLKEKYFKLGQEDAEKKLGKQMEWFISELANSSYREHQYRDKLRAHDLLVEFIKQEVNHEASN